MQSSLLIVLVNYKTPDLTTACIESLADGFDRSREINVCVVDNGSSDGSVDKIVSEVEKREWSHWVRVIALTENVGFAAGCNRGIIEGGPTDYVLLLNTDTIVSSKCIDHCVRAMDSDPSVGVMSCRLLNQDGSTQPTARRFPTPLRVLINSFGLVWRMPRLFQWADTQYRVWDEATEAQYVDWLGGTFMMLRRSALNRTGLLDEEFFFYGEDVEISYRMKRHGYRRLYDPSVSIVHIGGASSDVDRMSSYDRSVHWWRARYLVQKKCYGRVAVCLLRCCDSVVWHMRLIWAWLRRRHDQQRFDRTSKVVAMLRKITL